MLVSPPPALVALAKPFSKRGALCPEAPAASYPSLAACSAIEVSGHIAPGAVRLDPAFDVIVASSSLVRVATGASLAAGTLTGYTADGAVAFSVPVGSEEFRIDVPLALPTAASIRRIRLTGVDGVAERVATVHAEPSAELVDAGDGAFVFVWNASAFPAAHLTTGLGAPIALSGTGTFEQVRVENRARFVAVDFSDGTRSLRKTYRVFGR